MQGARRENREARWTGEPTQRGRAPRRRSPGTALPTRSRQITAGPRPSGRARRTGRRPPAGKRARGQSLSAERRDDHPPAGRRGPVSAHREKAEAWREQNPAGGQVRKGPPVSGRRRRPAPVGGAGGEILTGTGRARRRVPAGAARGGSGTRRPRRGPPRPWGPGPAAAAERPGAPWLPPAGGLSPEATRLRPETPPYEVVEVRGQGLAMETQRRIQSSSGSDSSPLSPPSPTSDRQVAHWPVQTPPGASRVSPFRPSPWRHRDAPPHQKLHPLPGHA